MTWRDLKPIDRQTVGTAPVTFSFKIEGRGGAACNLTVKGAAAERMRLVDGARLSIHEGEEDLEGKLLVVPDRDGAFVARIKKGETFNIRLPLLDCLILDQLPRSICDWEPHGGDGMIVTLPLDAWQADSQRRRVGPEPRAVTDPPGKRVVIGDCGPDQDFQRRRAEAEKRARINPAASKP